MLDQTGFHWIHQDVKKHLLQCRLIQNGRRSIALRKKRPRAPSMSVDALGQVGLEVFHKDVQIQLNRPQQQVEVIPHKYVRHDVDAVPFGKPHQSPHANALNLRTVRLQHAHLLKTTVGHEVDKVFLLQTKRPAHPNTSQVPQSGQPQKTCLCLTQALVGRCMRSVADFFIFV